MDNYLLEQVTTLDPTLVQDKTWLVVHKLHRTPYHIGLLYGKQYFALTVTGAETGPRTSMVEKLLDKTYNNLLIEIDVPQTMPEAQVKNFFELYILDHQQFRSCLFPIRDFMCAATANDQFQQPNNIFELLDLLKKQNLVRQKMATRMSTPMESKIVLMRYDQEAIRKHIKRLQERNSRETNHQ